MKVKVEKWAFKPEKAHADDAGFDIRTPVTACVMPRGSTVINTGVHVEIPKGYVGMLKSKSGLNVKNNLNGEGVIDCGYTGCIIAKLYNHGEREHIFSRGDKIIQLVVLPIYTGGVEIVDELGDTERGACGFGSTGR